MFGKKRREQRRKEARTQLIAAMRQEYLGQLERAEAGMLPEGGLLDASEIWFNDLDASLGNLLTYSERGRWEAAVTFPAELKELRELKDKYEAASGQPERIEALLLFVESYKKKYRNHDRLASQLGIKPEEAFELLKTAVQKRYEALLDQCDEREKFVRLHQLIARTRRTKGQFRYWEDNDFKAAGLDPLPYPDSWNDLVARHYDTPDITSFNELPDHRGPGDVRLLAAEAVRMDDFTQAQIALAYCNGDTEYCAAVGDVLTAELAKLVMQHRAEMAVTAELAEE